MLTRPRSITVAGAAQELGIQDWVIGIDNWAKTLRPQHPQSSILNPQS